MIGEIIAEFKGKSTGVRVLPDGKVESSSAGSGTILGIEASIISTGVGTPMPNGVTMAEGNNIINTADGEVVMVKDSGIGWPTGKGWKSTYRGASFHMTSSQKLARINKTVGVYEYESDENGDWKLKVWAWK